MDLAPIKRCPKCNQQVEEPFVQHFRQECALAKSVVSSNTKSVSFADGTHICLRCLAQFDEQKWRKHQRKIRTACPNYWGSEPPSTPTHSQSFMDEDSLEARTVKSATIRSQHPSKSNHPLPQSGFKKPDPRRYTTSLFSTSISKEIGTIIGQRQLTDDQMLALRFIDLLVAKFQVPISVWVKQNNKIKSVYLQKFFDNYCQRIITQLKHTLKVPTFQSLQQSLNIKWSKLLSDPSDIFDQKLMLEKVKDMQKTAKNKMFKYLNSLYKAQYQDVFPKFPIDLVIPVSHKKFQHLRTRDFLSILEQLFKSEEKDLVHIGIDLYLIFQSAQRFKSDKENLRAAVVQLIESRKTNRQLCQIQMKVNKTFRFKQKKSVFILSQQLCQLLENFQWSNYFRNGNIYQRLSRILGFPLKSLKKCIFSEFSLQKAQYYDLNLQKLADHHQLKVSLQHYSKFGEDMNIKTIKDKLIIPNLIYQNATRAQVFASLGKLAEFKRRIVIPNNWLQKLKTILKRYDQSSCKFYQHSNDKEQSQHQRQNQQISASEAAINTMLPQQKQTQQAIQPEKEEPSQQKQVQICGINYAYRDQKFRYKDLFLDGKISNCFAQNCSRMLEESGAGLVCIICKMEYHNKCVPLFCSCHKAVDNPIDAGVRHESSTNSKISLNMPEKYFKFNQENYNQMKFLLACRRFYYTPTAVILNQDFMKKADLSSLQNCKIEKVKLPRFQDYQKQLYFPPIRIGVSGYTTTSGTGFGLFATELIEKDTFIGQYAADILPSLYTIQVRRFDTIMDLVTSSRPHQSTIIGPAVRCGYVCLINGSKEDQANCSCLTAEINGFLRIIIYSKKKIKPGQQLYYNYAQNSSFTSNNLTKSITIGKKRKQKSKLLRKNNNKLEIQLKKEPFHGDCGLINEANSCYMNSVFQFLRMAFHENFQQNPRFLVQNCVYEIIQGMRYHYVYNPSIYVDKISQLSSFRFSQADQEDCHQFLVYLLENFSQRTQAQLQSQYISRVTCSQCSNISQSKNLMLTVEVPFSTDGQYRLNQEKVETIEDYHCLNCNKRTQATKSQRTIFGRIIIVMIKIWSNDGDKILEKQGDASFFTNSQQYRLFGIINHSGATAKSGHYRAIQCKNESVKVYDDERVYGIADLKEGENYIYGFYKIE